MTMTSTTTAVSKADEKKRNSNDDVDCSPPAVVVVCGPSGVGKGTLIDLLQKRFPNDQFGFSVSHTTRKPREGEVDGVHYHFSSIDKMQKAISQDKLIEHAQVHGNIYGTSFAAVASVQKEGKICILDIDVQGVRNVKKQTNSSTRLRKQVIYTFIAPPSLEELERRLRGRGTETEASIQKRLQNSKQELKYGYEAGNFDRVFINAELNATLEDMVEAFKEWYPQLVEADLAPDDDDVRKNCTACVVS